MNLQYRVFTVSAFVIGFAQASVAGTISSGGDSDVAFECTSLPTVDSDIKISGHGNEFNREIELFVFVGGKKVLSEIGVLSEKPEVYIGSLLEIQLQTEADPTHGWLKAKGPNPVISPDGTEALVCRRLNTPK